MERQGVHYQQVFDLDGASGKGMDGENTTDVHLSAALASAQSH